MTQYVNTYGSIGSRTNLYADEKFLAHAVPMQVLERYATPKKLPKNSTFTISFRRFIPWDVSDVPLQEGVTPTPLGIQVEDVPVSIKQYGAWVQITDVIQDTHEDPILNEQVPLCGENAAQVRELVNYGTFRAGTSVFYSSTTASPTLRTQVNAPITIQLVRKVKQFLDGQYAKPITRQLDASPDFNTSPVKPGYVAIGHTDLSGDLFDLPGFIPMEKYASGKPEEAEIGAAENLRFVLSAFLKPLASAGSTTLNGMRTTNGTNVDVYPILVVAKDAWGVVPLAGTERQIIRVLNPGTISASDPLGQRGFVSWKMWHAAVILNQNWCSRVEVGSTA